jgi:transcriptional regulator with XRE-family HTH domain
MRKPPDQVLAAVLKRLRQERGITQEQLAFDTALTVSALSRIERGLNNPTWTTVRSIAKALGMSMTDIVTAVEQVDHDEEI